MVWLVWVYTTWVTNWLDPDRLPVRLMLFALMLASLIMSTGLQQAFGARGLWIGVAYASMQIGAAHSRSWRYGASGSSGISNASWPGAW